MNVHLDDKTNGPLPASLLSLRAIAGRRGAAIYVLSEAPLRKLKWMAQTCVTHEGRHTNRAFHTSCHRDHERLRPAVRERRL